jgi:hypothetical protein
MSSKEFAERLFKAITGSILPPETSETPENPFEVVLSLCRYCHRPIPDKQIHHCEEGGYCHKGCCPICNEYGGEI